MRSSPRWMQTILSPTVMRTGIEWIIDTGPRTEEICDMMFDRLVCDCDGGPVSAINNHKANCLGRRLPINEVTADVITTAHQRAWAAYPETPVAKLKL